MDTKRVNAAAEALAAAQSQGKKTAAGLAIELEQRRLLQSPETAAEHEQVRARVTELEAELAEAVGVSETLSRSLHDEMLAGSALYAALTMPTTPAQRQEALDRFTTVVQRHGQLHAPANGITRRTTPAQSRGILDHARDALNARMAKDDLRLVLENVVTYAAELEAQRERRSVRLVALQNDALNMRGALSPNGEERKVPFPLGETLTPAVEWLIARVAELESKLAEFERPTDEDPIRYTLTAKAEASADKLTRLLAPTQARREETPVAVCRCDEPEADPYACEADDCSGRFSELNPFGQGARPVNVASAEVSRKCGRCGWRTTVWHVDDGSAEEELHRHGVRVHGDAAPVEDPHDSPLHHDYRIGRDMPETGGAR